MNPTCPQLESGPFRPALFLILAVVLSFAVCGPAEADWLVMNDGSRIETTGPWEIRGRMLLFHDSAGKLSSVRASDVHLEASEQLTEAAKRQRETAARPAKPVQRKSVLRLTDDDVSHVDPTVAPQTNSEGAEAAPSNESGLAVSSWDRDFDDETGGVLIRGSLRNGEAVQVRSVSLYVVLRSDNNTMVGRSRARLDRPFLKPGEETSFIATFPGITDFANAEFKTDATRPTPAASNSDTDDGGDDSAFDVDDADRAPDVDDSASSSSEDIRG